MFVSRHADRFGTEPDPSLTPRGEVQAESLGRMLAGANVRHIYTTELLRTQQTAAPTAQRSGITPVVVPQNRFDDLIEHIRNTVQPHESTLVVGHRETVPRIVKALTGQEIPPLTSGEYGRLIVITLFPDGRSSIVTLHYGD
ncbi:MAG TPA: histidine phosphatase family protein [Edaphobacter sp.]|nr:histidine phosphatase family protein [Edaphobacter sp.]